MLDKIEMNERNIRQALADYRRYTYQTEEIDNVSDAFIERLAADNYEAKSELRALFSKSPVWNDELDAIVINGSRTHNTDPWRVKRLANDIFNDWLRNASDTDYSNYLNAIEFFANNSSLTDSDKNYCIDAINTLAPKAYQPGKKITRVFRSLCQALNVTECDNSIAILHLLQMK